MKLNYKSKSFSELNISGILIILYLSILFVLFSVTLIEQKHVLILPASNKVLLSGIWQLQKPDNVHDYLENLKMRFPMF